MDDPVYEYDLIRLQKADSTHGIWIVPERVVSIVPCVRQPEIRSIVTIASGAVLTVEGNTATISALLEVAERLTASKMRA